MNQSLWLDEATSATVARDLGFREIITKFSLSDFHPPLYYVVLKFWSGLFGTTEISIRLLSIVFGILTIYLVFLIGKNLFNKNVGLIGAVLLATSGLHIYYSQEARMYSMVTFFTALAFYFFTKVEEGRVNWFLFSLTLPLIFLTDYLPITTLCVFWVYAIFSHKKFSWWKNFVVSHIPLLTSMIFWLPYFLRQLHGGLSVKASNWWNILGRTTFKEVLLIPAKFIIGRVTLENKLLYATVLGVLFLFFGSLILMGLKKIMDKREGIVALWLFVPTTILIIIGLFIPVLTYFRLLFVLAAFYILIAVGISSLGKKWMISAVVLILSVNIFSSGAYLLNSKFHREDWRGLVNFVETNRTKNSQVMFVANSQMESYKYYDKSAKISGPVEIDPKTTEIWLIRYVKDLFDPEDKLRIKVESQGFKREGEYDFNGIPVLKYENIN